MSVDRWTTVLVLGGIRSGKSAFAESLVADAPSVRYVATAAGGEDDPEWRQRIEAHQRRRPQSWTTEETGPDPARLTAVLTEAKPDDTLLIDDLGGWVAGLLDPARQPNDDVATVDALAEAVRSSAARVVIVSPEVGLSLVPVTPVGRAFADALGTANQALARACDGVALVVAGRALWLKGDIESSDEALVGDEPAPAPTPEPALVAPAPVAPAPVAPAPVAPAPVAPAPVAPAPVAPAPVAPALVAPAAPAGPIAESSLITPAPRAATPAAPGNPKADVLTAPTMMLPLVESGIVIQPGMDLPLPDSDAGPDARDRLATLDLPGLGVGALGEVVEFAAATQYTTVPAPWTAVRVLLLAGVHAGGAAAGTDPAEPERRITALEAGEGALARLAAEAGADVAVIRVPAAGAMEDGPVMDLGAVDAALREGWQLADRAAEDGRDALILGSVGNGTDAAATAVLAATTGAEPVAMLPRVLTPGGRYDDHAWMTRAAAIRDAMHRIAQEPRGATDVLAQLGGPDVAVAAGALLGATQRRIPVLLDGPVGIAAAMIARDLAGQARHWCLLPDAGTHALVRQGADVLGLTPVVSLGLDLGEGVGALAVLPLLRTAIGLAGALPRHPALQEIEPNDDPDTDFAEPEPSGPGPAAVPDDE